MVIYDLFCEYQHEFEGWFKNADDFTQQRENGLLTCPYCDSSSVQKKVTAAKVTRKSNASNPSSPSTSPSPSLSTPTTSKPESQAFVMSDEKSADDFEYVQKLLHHVHDYIDENFVDVGNKFAEEAVSIHKGEKEAENIRGTANREQLTELAKEGIQTLPIPARPIEKKKLN